MTKVFLFVMVLLLKTQVFSQKCDITGSLLEQVYLIQTDTLQGTCFLIEHEGEEYLITVKHIFKKHIERKNTIKINNNKSNFTSYSATVLEHSDSTVDLVVLKLPVSIKTSTPYTVSSDVIIGDDVYFLGFPNLNGLQFANISPEKNMLPLVKKGLMSGTTRINNYFLYLLDGHNNPGFSGGPVITRNKSNKDNICAVVSGYYNENKLAIFNSKTTDLLIQENSGIIISYPMNLALDIIKANK